ncbi:hypothetical protein HDE76_003847 [Rhodanobacter sp. ANJX3]|uniref:hypothetical protein n=1 Tax=Rhodanobacter sp. ANJX3 TaxID=2723083 RepID=UPI00160C0BB2|nr:hypothetical protein [Rhodanobacter sp. ANJX3]MBB5360602.1 hypothetical protein [Rhodanobacter sp. ANJX3]
MHYLTKLSVFGMAFFTSVQSICAPVAYRLIESNSYPQCGAFLEALERAGVAAMSDQQICNVMNSRITDLIKGKDFSEVAWTPLPIPNDLEKREIAKKVYEARLDRGHLQRFARDEAKYLSSFTSAISKTDIIFEKADLKVGHEPAYALQYRRS